MQLVGHEPRAHMYLCAAGVCVCARWNRWRFPIDYLLALSVLLPCCLTGAPCGAGTPGTSTRSHTCTHTHTHTHVDVPISPQICAGQTIAHRMTTPHRGTWQQCVRLTAPIMRRHLLFHGGRPQTRISGTISSVSSRSRWYSFSSALPPPLSFSIELSLPHLSGRTPFAAAAGAATPRTVTCSGEARRTTQTLGGQHVASTNECPAAKMEKTVMISPGRQAMRTEELMACLLGLPSSSPASPRPLMQQQWLAFVRLCDSLMRVTACPCERGVVAATTSTRVQASRHSLVGVIVPCKEVYFSARHVEATAERADPRTLASASLTSASAEDMSTSQAALFLLHHHWKVPVTLTINTTVPNGAARATESGSCTQPRSHGEQASAHATATPNGIDAVVTDFVFAQGGSRLLLVRGDSPPDFRLSLSKGISSGPLSEARGTVTTEEASPLQQARRTLRTSADLVRHVSVLRDRQQQEHKTCDGGTCASTLELLWRATHRAIRWTAHGVLHQLPALPL
ncbi:hypothetical protein, unknown function [Leishmania tarentolae]|uniref:Uncharacterized protein n=1 Tax=Leishmania tarentolae TaxID=5689 RepID=A0A640KAW0_LEITA|nr:hypothetical protein, unknown function [Leishmania tarentolae]